MLPIGGIRKRLGLSPYLSGMDTGGNGSLGNTDRGAALAVPCLWSATHVGQECPPASGRIPPQGVERSEAGPELQEGCSLAGQALGGDRPANPPLTAVWR